MTESHDDSNVTPAEPGSVANVYYDVLVVNNRLPCDSSFDSSTDNIFVLTVWRINFVSIHILVKEFMHAYGVSFIMMSHPAAFLLL